MKRLRCGSFAKISAMGVLAAALPLGAAQRPRYGGTLRVEWKGSIASLDPAQPVAGPADEFARQRLFEMIADRLVRLDDAGQPQPSLAVSWQHDAAYKRWELQICPGVKFSDGTPVTSAAVAASLAAANPGWSVAAAGNAVIIESGAPLPDLLFRLALTRNSVVLREPDGGIAGSGPFRLTTWEPGRHAVLAANEEYWQGRPFVDSIDIRMARKARERLIDLELGKSDVVEMPAERARLAALRGLRVSASDPVELLAIVFQAGSPAIQDVRVRQALGLSMDRAALVNFVLQKEGVPAASLLPQWLSGYAFLFSAAPDLAAARQLVAQSSPPPSLELGHDAADPLERLVAERIVVNARDAGISVSLQPAGASGLDAQLVRLPLGSPDPGLALSGLLAELVPFTELGPAILAPADSAGPEGLYTQERAIVDSSLVIPLAHIPQVVGLSQRVRDWMPERFGPWRLADVWLEGESP